MQSIETLRDQLNSIDRMIIELAAERQMVVKSIASLKHRNDRPTRDFEREKEVMTRAAAVAAASDLSPNVARELMQLLIRSSLTAQERHRISSNAAGRGQRALVIGGSGRMGRWFADFLDAQGFDVAIADPTSPSDATVHYSDWHTAPLDEDLIVVAAPLRESRRILDELATIKPAGLIFDIGSVKAPLAGSLRRLAEIGCRITSLHPMFGPDTALLSERHIIFVDVGNRDATREAQTLFEPTMAEQVDMNLDDHDHMVAVVLGLSHALNIAFFTALARSGETAPDLAGVSSTTFDAQLDVARAVAVENPRLYFEIQSLNTHVPAVLRALVEATQDLRNLVCNGQEEDFIELMTRGSEYFNGLGRTADQGQPTALAPVKS